MPVFSYAPQIWYDLLAALFAALLAAYAWPRRFVRGGSPFIAFQIVLSLLFLMQSLITSASTLSLKTLIYQWLAVAAVWASLLALWFAIDYAGWMKRVSRAEWVLLCLPLVIFSALILTNGAHGWVGSQAWENGRLQSTLGVAGVAGVLYTYLIWSMSLAILLTVRRRAHGILRWQAGMFFAGTTFTSLGFAAGIVRSHTMIGPAFSAILLAVGLLSSAVALLRFRAFDLTPIDRYSLVHQMPHGMMVIDDEHRIVDLNQAAGRLLAADGWKEIGGDVREVLAQWPELLRIVSSGGESRTEVAIDDGQERRVFDASVSPLLDLTGGHTARLILWIDVTEMKATQAKVERQRSALAALAEREWVARELHDGLAQGIGCIKMEAQAASDALERGRPEAARASLQNILAVSQEAHEEIRDFLLGAKVMTRANGDFWSAVTDFAERYSTFHGLRVEVSLPACTDEFSLDLATQVQLLRIIQESLANVRRHAEVSTANLTITCEGSCMYVTVRDNGRGFDPYADSGGKDGHYGLNFMRQRAQEVGGRLEVISAPGQGTYVLVQVPVSVRDGGYATAPGG